MFKKIIMISALLFCFTLSAAQADVISYYFDGIIDYGHINDYTFNRNNFTGSFIYNNTEAIFSINIPDIMLQSSVRVEAQEYIVTNNDPNGADRFIVRGQEHVGMFDDTMSYTVILTNMSGEIFGTSTKSETYDNPYAIVMSPDLSYAKGTSFSFWMDDLLTPPSSRIYAEGHFNKISTTDPNAPPAAATPEPASVLLTGLGLAGLIALGRRRKAMA